MKTKQQELEETIKRAQSELDDAQRQIEELKNAPAGNPSKLVGKPTSGGISIISQNAYGRFLAKYEISTSPKDRPTILCKDKAEAFATGMNTLFELLACDGVEEIINDVPQYYVGPNGDALSHYGAHPKSVIHTAWFSNRECAIAARDKVGKQKIIDMYKQLSFIGV